MPRFFHTTDAATAILADGFRDSTGSYLFANFTLTGVWIADSPLDVNEGAKDDQVLALDLPDNMELDEYEIVEDIKGCREWCVPAGLINSHAEVTLLTQEQLDAMWLEETYPKRETPMPTGDDFIDTYANDELLSNDH
jgi:hypothetical protein